VNCEFVTSVFVCLEQDVGLEALARVVGRQKQIALDIGDEVESQNGLFTLLTCTLH